MSIQNISSFIDNDGTDEDEIGTPNTQLSLDLEDDETDHEEIEDDAIVGDEDEEDELVAGGDDDSNVEDNAGEGDDPNDTQQNPQQEETVQPNILLRQDGTATDKQGNIVDPTSGKLIARAGSERRLYESNVRLNARLKEVEQQTQQYRAIAENTNNLYTELAKSGLSPDQIGGGIELVVQYHQNPLEATRKILAQTVAMGYNVSQIVGEGVGDAIEMSAIKQMLDQRLASLQPQQTNNTPVRQEDNDRRVIEEFVRSHPGSQVHLQTIGQMVARSNELGQPISATEAYERLREFCFQKGLDFNKPLPERKPASQNQRVDRQQPRNPLPPRRSARPNPGVSMKDTGLAQPNDSWDSIVRSALKGK